MLNGLQIKRDLADDVSHRKGIEVNVTQQLFFVPHSFTQNANIDPFAWLHMFILGNLVATFEAAKTSISDFNIIWGVAQCTKPLGTRVHHQCTNP